MRPFIKGIKDGIPIALGYFSVAFGFGIWSVSLGLTVLQAVGISATSLTSAGQVAGVGIIAAGGTILEMIIAQLVINIRYSLMGISLSQKLDDGFTITQRLIVSFGITDEIFAVAYSQREKIKAAYMYGLIVIAFISWTSGTLLGGVAGTVLPVELINAMGIMLYGMFLAVIIPAAKTEKGAFFTITIAAAISIAFKYAWPLLVSRLGFPAISDGIAVIISAIIGAAISAWLFPIRYEEEERV